MSSPRLIVAYQQGSPSPLEIFSGLQGASRVIWLVDATDPSVIATTPFLERTGVVVDAFGREPDQAAAALREHQAEGIITFYDARMSHLAAIAAALELPFQSVRSGRALEDKLEQRAALMAAGIPTPQFMGLPASNRHELIRRAEVLPFPAIVKPRRSSGSRDMETVESAAELVALWDRLSASHSDADGEPPDAFFVEAYLSDGPGLADGFAANYLSVETVAMHGHLYHLAVTSRLPLASGFRETGGFMPALLDDDDHTAVLELADAALRSVSFHTGCAHTELKLTGDGWRVIEINGRLGGRVADMLRIAAGLEMIKLAADAALGRFEPPPPLRFGQVSYQWQHQPPTGRHRIVSIDGIESISSIPGVDSVTLHHSPGDVVDSRDGTASFLVVAVGAARDHADLVKVAEQLRAALTVEYEPEPVDPQSAARWSEEPE